MRSMKFAIVLLALVLIPAMAQAQASLVGIPDGPNVDTPSDPLNLDRAMFSVASFDDNLGREWIYFATQNERILLNIRRTNGTWVYNPSRVVLEGPPGSTAGVGAVFSQDSATYRNARDSSYYKYVMYMGYQLATAGHAGGACASFSNDGINWTVPIALQTTAGPIKDCEDGSDVRLEAISGFHRTGTEMHIFGLEGDFGLLQQYVGQGRTLTYFFRAYTSNPHRLTLDGEVSEKGLFSPTISGGLATSYFINLDVTYDAATGRHYLFRVYPYPYRPTSSSSDPDRVPCSGVCPADLGTYPMRGQIYYMDTGGATWKTLQGTWTLLVDGGGVTGWSARACPTCACAPYPLIDSRQIVIGGNPGGLDLDSISVKKTRLGRLAPVGTEMIVFFGGWEDRQESCDFYSSAFKTFLDGNLYRVNVGLP